MLLKLRNITKHYRVGAELIRALDGVDLDINEGEYVAVMGASGSGKSTLMNILGCLDRPTGGTYDLSGHRVDRMNAAQLARVRNREIGFVFQGFNLIPTLSAHENVDMALEPLGLSRAERTLRVTEALTHVGLGDRTDHRPGELSGGQQQRVAIARALAGSPRLLIADEPTGQLDAETGLAVMALLRGIVESEGVTAVVATHDPVLVALADRVLTIADGRVGT